LAAALLIAVVTWSAIRIAGGAEANLLDLTSVARLTHDPEFSEWPTWSPDGKMLAFASNRSGNYEIYVRRIEGGQEVNVTNDPGQDFQPDFSPDGNWIAFVPRAAGSGQDRVRRGCGVGNEFRTLGGEISNAISRNADSRNAESRNPKSLSLPIAHGKTTSTKAIRSWSNVVRLLNTTGCDTMSALR